MGLLHPKYNHLGRSKRTTAKIDPKAKAQHRKFLMKYGIDPDRKPKLRGAVPLANAFEHRQPNVSPTSDCIAVAADPSLFRDPNVYIDLTQELDNG